MEHLPPYVVLARLASARRVVVVRPTSPEGPRLLRQAGARQVVMLEPSFDLEEAGLESRPLTMQLPLRDASIDLVCCIEGLVTLSPGQRRDLLRESHRALRDDGLLAAWVVNPQRPQEPRSHTGAHVDFWVLEDELLRLFPHVSLIAQMPWSGYSLAPVVDEGAPDLEPTLRLADKELDIETVTTHYLVVASKTPLPLGIVRDCVLVPLPGAGGNAAADLAEQLEAANEDLERLRDELGVRAARAAAVQRRARELEDEVSRLRGRVGSGDAEEPARLRAALSQAESLLLAAQDRGVVLEKRGSELEARALALAVEKTAAEERASRLGAEIAAQEAELRKLVEQREDQSAVLARQSEHERAAQRHVELEQDLAIHRAREVKLTDELRREHEERALVDASLADAAERLRQAESRHARELLKVEQLQESIGDGRTQLEQARSQERELIAKLRSQETDLAILSRAASDRDQALTRAIHEIEERRLEIERLRTAELEGRRRGEVIAAERDELRRQSDVLVIEREAARKDAARFDAELEVSRKRFADQSEQLASATYEVSRLSGAGDAMRQRLAEQEQQIADSRSRTEVLSVQAEQGRLLADVALDRDRLRDELTRRGEQIAAAEERIWGLREHLQKERIDGARAIAELEQVKETLERTRVLEREQSQTIERLSKELREVELSRAEHAALVRIRDERISHIEAEMKVLSGRSSDLEALRISLHERGTQLSAVSTDLEQAKASSQVSRARETELAAELERERARVIVSEQRADEVGRQLLLLGASLEAKQLEIDRGQTELDAARETVAALRRTETELRGDHGVLQRRLEDVAAEQRALRHRLTERERELDEVSSSRPTVDLELQELRRDLARTEQRSDEVPLRKYDDRVLDDGHSEAVALELQRLRGELERSLAGSMEERMRTVHDRMVRFHLESQVRAAEQEFMLGQIDSAEQRIWEMTDEAGRNAALYAASLAQLERQREVVEQANEQLEVTRSLLVAEQERALEQERLLASERAKMARAGIDASSGYPRMQGDDYADPFAELTTQRGARMLSLSEQDRGSVSGAAAPHEIRDEQPTAPLSVRRQQSTTKARVVVERNTSDDDDDWPDDESPASRPRSDETKQSSPSLVTSAATSPAAPASPSPARGTSTSTSTASAASAPTTPKTGAPTAAQHRPAPMTLPLDPAAALADVFAPTTGQKDPFDAALEALETPVPTGIDTRSATSAKDHVVGAAPPAGDAQARRSGPGAGKVIGLPLSESDGAADKGAPSKVSGAERLQVKAPVPGLPARDDDEEDDLF